MGVYKDLNDYEIMYLVSENNEDAKEVLFQKYYPIIVKTANKYKLEAKKCGLEIDDLIQEGYFGLSCAINYYNHNKDAIFYTYAIMCIKSKILNALKIANNKKSYCLNNYISLFRNVDSNEESMLMEFISDSKADYPENILFDKELMFLFKEFLYNLDISNSTIFELKFNGFSNSDISKLLGISLRSVSNSLCRSNEKFRKYFNSKEKSYL